MVCRLLVAIPSVIVRIAHLIDVPGANWSSLDLVVTINGDPIDARQYQP